MKQRDEHEPASRSSEEQRRLRSRVAARCRRVQEAALFSELAVWLPLSRRARCQLDRVGVLRVAVSFLRLRGVLRPGSEDASEDPVDAVCPQALDGFVLLLTEDGDVLYLTEGVSRYTGLTQLELLSHSVYDFIHPGDEEELRELLSARPALSEQQTDCDFFLRLKSALTSRGRSVNIKSAAWKVFRCRGVLRAAPPVGRVLTLLCEPVPQPDAVEFPLDSFTLLTRHSLDLSFTHCQGRVTELVGYRPEDLIGRSAFQFHHELDSQRVRESIHTLLSKGQVITAQYRFLARGGGFVWVETQASVLYSSREATPPAVVCLNYILSGVEQPDVVFSVEQTRCSHPAAGCSAEDSQPEDDVDTEDTRDAGDAGDSMDSTAVVDSVSPLAGALVELCFSATVTSDPARPEELCSPQLHRLLAPIFCPPDPPSPSSSAQQEEEQQEQQEEQQEQQEEQQEQQSCSVLKFFSVCEQPQQQDVLDLDSLAPYISMDDFQLSVSSSLTVGAPCSAASRKRTHQPDEDMLRGRDKRQKPDGSSEDDLLVHQLLLRLQDQDQDQDLDQDQDQSRKPTNQMPSWRLGAGPAADGQEA